MNVDKIKLWWFNDNNFGDQIGPYLVHKLTGKKVVYVEHLRLKTDNFFLLIRQLDLSQWVYYKFSDFIPDFDC